MGRARKAGETRGGTRTMSTTDTNMTIEKRLAALEAWKKRVSPYINRTIPCGPRETTKEEEKARHENFQAIVDAATKHLRKDVPPVDRTNQQLVDGGPVPKDWSHTK